MTEFNTLEISKLPPEADNSELWYWMKFIKSNDKEELDMLAERNPQMRKAIGILKELSDDERTRMLYEKQEMFRRDMVSRTEGAVKQREIEIARSMIAKKEPFNKIMEYTGLTLEEIEAISEEQA